MGYSAADFPFTIMDVASLLRLNIRRRGSGQIYVDCPICGDRRGKMNLNLTKNVWRCNYCGEGGGMLALYAQVYGISKSDAYQQICEALQTGDHAPAYTPPSKTELPEEVPQSEQASQQTIHQTLTALLSNLTLTEAHRKHLHTKRGLTDAQIEQFGFKSTPAPYLCRAVTERLVKQGHTVQGVPGFYVNDNGKWTVKFHQRTSGILIPVRNVDGLLCGLQTRLDKPIKDKDDKPGKTGIKYLTLSSTGKKMGAAAKCPVHFVGDPLSRVVYVTEGALKADVAHALTGRTFAATIGANNTGGLDGLFAFLSRNGTEEIIEAEDMDKYSNDAVSKGASKVCRLAAKYGMTCRRLVWNPNYKGIDDWQLALRRKNEVHKEAETINLEQQSQSFRVYQLELEGITTCPFAFRGIKTMHAAGFQQPPAAEYRLVYDGVITHAKSLEPKAVLYLIHTRCNDTFPKDYLGHSLSMSDVVELYDEGTRHYFYCDEAGFTPVQFDFSLARSMPIGEESQRG